MLTYWLHRVVLVILTTTVEPPVRAYCAGQIHEAWRLEGQHGDVWRLPHNCEEILGLKFPARAKKFPAHARKIPCFALQQMSSKIMF